MFIPNKNLENEIRKQFDKSLLKGAKVLMDKAKNNAPVKSGKLRREIKIGKVKSGDIEIISEADYSEHVEYGTMLKSANPYMRLAVKESVNKVLEKFRGII